MLDAHDSTRAASTGPKAFIPVLSLCGDPIRLELFSYRESERARETRSDITIFEHICTWPAIPGSIADALASAVQDCFGAASSERREIEAALIDMLAAHDYRACECIYLAVIEEAAS